MTRLWRYSSRDSALVLMTAGQLVATILWATSFAALPLWANLLLFPLMTFYHYHNTICATHSFIHCPYFARKWMNRAFSVANTLNLFVPNVLYKYHHILHHRYGNDPVRGGTTLDPSSTYRYGRDGKHEHLVPYALAGVFRGSNFAWDEVKKRHEMKQLYAELCGMALLALALLWVDWRFFAAAYLPMVYLSWIMTHVENYYDHYRAANPDDRFGDSVSYYGKLFNFLYFNEGYHLEHHIQPSVHWTRRGALVDRFKDQVAAAGSEPARFPSLLGFLE